MSDSFFWLEIVALGLGVMFICMCLGCIWQMWDYRRHKELAAPSIQEQQYLVRAQIHDLIDQLQEVSVPEEMRQRILFYHVRLQVSVQQNSRRHFDDLCCDIQEDSERFRKLRLSPQRKGWFAMRRT